MYSRLHDKPLGDKAIYSLRFLRIVVVGAGPSGLLLAYKLQRSFQHFDLDIYDSNAEVSGTWYVNRYPGCASDLPSPNYTYTFEPKYDCPSSYASGSEIKEYFGNFSRKHRLSRYTRLQHQVVGARWDNDPGVWVVEVEDLRHKETYSKECDIFVNAGGYLNIPTIPSLPGMDSYKGALIHSANWTDRVEIEGKRVALLGNGASGVQILPAIQPLVEHVAVFMRSPVWLLPPIGLRQHPGFEEQNSASITLERLLVRRKANESVINEYFKLYFSGSSSQNIALSHYNQAVQDYVPPHLPKEKLFPSSGAGCKRLVAGSDYLRSLRAPNVKPVYGRIMSLTQDGCTDSNSTAHSNLDVIICATGFDTSYISRFPIIGLDGTNIQEYWDPQPRSYLGIAADKFPNYFTLLGPYSPTANGTLIPGLEAQVDCILAFIDRYQSEANIHSFAPKAAAVDDFLAHHAAFMEDRPWLHDSRTCPDEEDPGTKAKIPLIWPGTTLHYREAIKEIRFDDWDIVYKGNRFACLGNGISRTEMDPEADLAWYLTDRDQSSFASRAKRREVQTRRTRVEGVEGVV